MATSPEVLAEKRELAGINSDYKEKFGFNDPESGYASVDVPLDAGVVVSVRLVA